MLAAVQISGCLDFKLFLFPIRYFSLFLESVLVNHGKSENEIAKAVQIHLKYAPDRKGGERSSKKINKHWTII